jgi:hypothetical protein
MKKVYVFILIIFCCLSATNKIMAQNASGTTGSCTWTLTGTPPNPNYTLTISGNGAMADYGNSGAPWFNNRANIKTLIIQQGVTHIGSNAFYDCGALTSALTIPTSVTSIGNYAFYRCRGLTGALRIPNSVTTIEEGAFYDCSGLTGSLTIPNTITTIGKSVFSGCSGLTGTLTIPSSVTTIGDYAFSSCSGLTGALTIPNTVSTIGNYAFAGCSGFTSLTIPNTMTTISKSAFSGWSLASMTIPDWITTVGDNAFDYSSMTTLTIGSSVTSLGSYAFYYCTKIKYIYAKPTTPPSLGTYTLNFNHPNPVTIYVPCGYLTAYQNAGWPYNLVEGILFNVTVRSANTTMGTASVTQQPSCTNGNTAKITATPNTGYLFSKWSDGSTQRSRTISLTSDITLTATFTLAPPATANMITASDTIICHNTSATLTASASSVTSPVFKWYSSQSTETVLHTGESYPTSNVTANTTFYVSVSGDNYSENAKNDRKAVTVTVKPYATSSNITTNDTTICSGTTATLRANSSISSATYKWYSSQTATNALRTNANYTTPILSSSTTYYVSVSGTDYCENTTGNRKAVRVSIQSISVSVLEEICPGITTQLTPNSGGSWTSSSSDSNIVEIINSGTIIGKKLGTATLTFYDSSTTCSTSVEVKVKDYPNPEEITGETVVCEGKTIELTNTTPNGVWTKNNDNISFDNPQANPVKVTGVTKGNSFVTYTVFEGVCQTKRTFRLKVIPVPTTLPKIIIGVERN